MPYASCRHRSPIIHISTFSNTTSIQVLEEICVCGVVFTDRDTEETTITHLLINWASATASFFSRRSSRPELGGGKGVFPLQLFQSVKMTAGDGRKVGGGREVDVGRSERGRRSPKDARILSGSSSGGDSGSFVQGVDVPSSTMQFGALWRDPPPFIVSWGSVSCSPGTGPIHSGTGTYVYRLSPMGDLSAVVVNQKRARDTRVIFFSPLTQVGVSVCVYPPQDESKIGR